MLKVGKLESFTDKIPVKGRTQAMLDYIAQIRESRNIRIPVESFRAYAPIKYKVPLAKINCSYSVKKGSIELPQYNGPRKKEIGKSTKLSQKDDGGGWIKGSLSTPLNTRGVHDCAVLNLINEAKEEHLLFHVHPDSTASDIEEFLKKYFPTFNRINILGGDIPQTQGTVNRILEATERLNPQVKTKFYHSPVFRPEIVAYNGEMSHIKDSDFIETPFREYKKWYISAEDHS